MLTATTKHQQIFSIKKVPVKNH